MLLNLTRHREVEVAIHISGYKECCKGNSAIPQKDGVQRNLWGSMVEVEDMVHMLRLKHPFRYQRLFLCLLDGACTLCLALQHPHMYLHM